MAQRGGVDALSPELLESAERNYEKWSGDKEKYDLANYVDFVQKQEHKRRDSGQQQEQDPPQPAKEYERYKVGELVVVDQYGNIHELNAKNTGDELKARAEHLKDIDLTPLQSVTAAQGAMKLYQQHKRLEREYLWEEKQREQQRDRDDKYAATAAPQLGKTDSEIRLAYSLTSTGQEFANAVEDRGLALAHITEAEAERLNRWDRRRLQELDAATPADRKRPEKLYDPYQAGELVVVNQYGTIHQLTARNTGDDAKARAEHLKDIDRAPLLSVTEAQSAMNQLQQHQREERQQERQQQWEEKQNQWQSDREAAAAKDRDQLRGITAKIFKEWQRNNEDKSFTATLDKMGVRFAITTKEEAERSHKQAALAKAAGNYAPSFKEGELVAVTRPSLLYWTQGGDIVALNRVHKLQEGAENYLPDIDRTKLKTIEATKDDLEKEARYSREDMASIRRERATDTGPFRVFRPVQTARRWILAANDKANDLNTVAEKPMRVIGSVVNTAAKLFDALFSFFDPGPPKTREQIAIAKDDRNRSNFAAEQTREQVQRHDTQVTVHERIAEATREIQQLAEKNTRDFQRYRSDERDRER